MGIPSANKFVAKLWRQKFLIAILGHPSLSHAPFLGVEWMELVSRFLCHNLCDTIHTQTCFIFGDSTTLATFRAFFIHIYCDLILRHFIILLLAANNLHRWKIFHLSLYLFFYLFPTFRAPIRAIVHFGIILITCPTAMPTLSYQVWIVGVEGHYLSYSLHVGQPCLSSQVALHFSTANAFCPFRFGQGTQGLPTPSK